jgi:hypothetical protein
MVASGALNVAAPGLADASPSAPVAFVDEPFTGAGLQVPSDWEVPSVPSGTNAACLTALTATSTTIPVPACGGTHDVAGNGALRLTGAATGEEGGVADDVALPSAQGLDITFDTYQYASSASCNPISTCAADGIMFFLAAANPADPQPPTTLGEPGGYLAYSGNTTGGGPGLDNGYLGVGLDEFGNYTNSNFDGAGCSDPFWAGTNNNTVPNEVSVRGPGSTTSGYCLLSSTAAEGLQGQLATGATGTRSTSEVPVEVALNPTGTAYSTHSGLSVPAYSYVVAVTPLGGATQLVSGTLPYDSYLPSSDSSWLYPSTGIPRQLVLGFAASTGQYDEIHEITNVQASPLASQPPQLGLTLSDTEAGALVKGTSDLYTATGLVASTGGPEASAPTLVATFPTGVAPGSASGTNWTCATASATVSCNYTGPVPISAGSSLSAVSIPATVATNAAGAQEVGATLWESGDVVAQASDTGAPVAAAQGAPILGLTFSDNAAGQLAQGETVTYTATGQVSSEGGADNGPISLAATLPSDESIATASGTNWSCVTSAPTVTCTWTGGNVAAGSALAPVAVQVTVGNDASGASAASATLSSPSASPGSVTDDDESVVASTPTLDVAVTDSDSGNPSGLTPSDPVDYTVNASVSASGWNEADAPAITDNFPRLFSSVTEDVSSTYWSCAAPVTGTAAITETCSYTGSLPIAAGTSLQPLQFDNIVSSSANPGATADDSVAVQSSDAPVAVATDYARIGEPPAPNLAITASAPSSATSSYTLALNAYVLATGGGASHHLIVAATLPTDESFTSASGSGWSCTISGGNGSLSCNTTTAISAGTALPTIQAEVDPSGVGLHTAQVTLADSLDGAFSVATSSTTESPLPVLVLGASPMTAQAAAGGSYTLSLSGSTSPAGGEVWNTLALVVTLPNYESFPAAPASSGGWSCTVPGTNDQQLNCTYAVSTPLAPGTALAAVAPVVDVSGSATGTLTATAMLEDAGDGATSAEQQPSVTVTATPVLSLSTTGTPTGASAGSTYQVTFTSSVASGGPAYNEPSLSVTLPSGESFLATAPTPAGWNCTVPGGGPTYQALDCTATAAIPIVAGTSLGGVQATVAISSSAPLTTLTTTASLADTADGATAATASAPVLVTAPPGLTLTMSPTTSPVAANTSYQIQLSPRLNSTGPAYHDPQLTVTLSAGETFATPAPAPTGWGTCAISTGGTVLSCTSTKLGTISAGSPLGGVTATVDIGPAASGGLGFETTASLSDAADAATPATTNQTVQVTPSPVLVLTTWGTPAGATVDNSYTLNLAASLSNAGGPAYHDPALTVTLPAGETFATPAPAPAGWGTCVISSGGTVLSCTSTHSVTISAGTSLGTVAATVDVGTGASGVLTTTAGLSDLGDGATTVTQAPSVTITTPPILALALAMSIGSSPAGAVAGTQYTLTIEPSVGGSSGPAYNEPTLVVTLPTGETFTPPGTTPNGWDCVISSNDTTLTCTSSDPTPIAAGGSLGNIQMTVVIASGARGTLTTNASLADSSDDATAAPTAATVLVTGAPVFALTTSGTPASASAPSTYTLTLTPSLRASGGTAWNDPVLTATLPTGETFQSPVPTPAGWSCAYSSANSDLQCTSTAAPVTAGSALGPVSVTVDIASSASGTLTTIVTLSDSTDLATPITLEPAVGITPPAPPSGGPEPPPVPIPSPTTTTTSGTSTSTTSTSTTSTSTTSTTSTSTTSTTTVSSTTTTAPGGGGKAGTGPLQTPVLPPVLKIVASAPKSVAAGTSFTLKLSVSLATNGGPAYHDPAFSVDLPANTSFATPAPSSSDWSCTVATGYAVLTCTWKAKVPQRAGASLGSITARVNVAPDASGRATVEANVADTADAARSAQASATIEITPAPGTPGGPPGPKGPGAGGAKSAGTSYYGYRLVAADGGVFSFGDASYSGSCEQKTKPCGPRDKVTVSALASSPKAKGYWLAARSGAVYTFGGAHNYGSCPEDKRVCGTSRSPIVGMAAAANGKGYWLVAANGTVFAFGSATGHGSCATSVKACGKVHAAVVGMVATPDGKGYWLVEKTGKVVPFGDARAQSRCSTSAKSCGQHLGVVTGIAAAATGQGYWLVNTAGRVYASGSAKFLGDVYTANAEKGLRGTIVGITAMPSGAGYWLVSSDGLVIAAKGTKFLGDAYTAKVKKLNHPMVGIAYT